MKSKGRSSLSIRASNIEPPAIVCTYREQKHDFFRTVIDVAPSIVVTAAIVGVTARQLRFGQHKSVSVVTNVTTKFADIAGVREAKLELQEIVEFLKNPDKFQALGAKIPRGCLLVGPPGVGKTMLARAVAGEAGVPFFACAASEFVEMYVGVGASRVRSLFNEARKKAPAIIFIDEIETLGKQRSSNSEERDQTINQLLTEMDGFINSSCVIVLAATNRADLLDKALIRPGRFDRLIQFDAPTLEEREAILAMHTANKPLDSSVSLHSLAKITTGMSGAELANIANEAAILAARAGNEHITMQDFNRAYDRILLGHEKTTIITHQKKQIIAAHEAGHVVTAMRVGDFEKVSKVSIIPRGNAAGITLFEQDVNDMHTRTYLENKLVVALGGRAAEELVFGHNYITTGSAKDLEYVERIARAMITEFGYSKHLSNVAWKNPDISPAIHYKIDHEIKEITEIAYKKAMRILENNRDLFNAIAEGLMTHEVISHEYIERIDSMVHKVKRNE